MGIVYAFHPKVKGVVRHKAIIFKTVHHKLGMDNKKDRKERK